MSGWIKGESEAREGYRRVVDELKNYPWAEVGVPCWAKFVHLFRSNTWWITIVWYEKHGALPGYVPNPIWLSAIPGVHCTSGHGWDTAVKGSEIVEKYIP